MLTSHSNASCNPTCRACYCSGIVQFKTNANDPVTMIDNDSNCFVGAKIRCPYNVDMVDGKSFSRYFMHYIHTIYMYVHMSCTCLVHVGTHTCMYVHLATCTAHVHVAP